MGPIPRHFALTTFALVVPMFAIWAAPQTAEACGGTFCDSGPNAMPVDQTGENILFVMDGGYTEAHIQIQYDPDTDAENFAWLVPVSVIPEFSVGSEAMFQAVLAGTVPQYGFQRTSDDCGSPGGDDGGAAPPSADNDGGKFDLGPAGPSGPDVVLTETVGAFEIVVLSGGTSEEVMTWLGDNGYQQDPAAEPILAQYLAEGMMFAAFKLRVGADTSEVHPVVLRFSDLDEACIPLRLTKIAAADDMDVRAFFLADDRVVPRNYRHVLVNPLKIDWPNFADNYKEVITLAVDAEGADGRAFVTEYAGPTSVVNTAGLVSSQWNADAFADLAPDQAVVQLWNQGLLDCSFGACQFGHTLIEGLMTEYLPVPDGVTPDEFYGCPRCYIDQFDLAAWDGVAFGLAIQERIIDPGQHAEDILSAFPYLTRMYTTISGTEMTTDPLFFTNAQLPDVVASRMATQRTLCNGDAVWTLPDGREVYLPAGADWPAFDDEMPWEEDITEMPDDGNPLALVDRTVEIDALLAAYNAGQGWPGGGAGGDDSGGGTGGATDGIGFDSDDAGLDGEARNSGCACEITRDERGAPAALLGGLLLLGLRRRRSLASVGR
jgi:hypothetical protein